MPFVGRSTSQARGYMARPVSYADVLPIDEKRYGAVVVAALDFLCLRHLEFRREIAGSILAAPFQF
jgi:hypothetical protein